MNVRFFSMGLSALVLVAVVAEVACNDQWINLVLYSPFYGYPMLVGMFISICSEKPVSQMCLAAGSVLFGVWYFCAMKGVFKVLHNPGEEIGYMADILNSVNYVLVGVFALPLMIAVWGVVGWCERRERPGFYKKPKNGV